MLNKRLRGLTLPVELFMLNLASLALVPVVSGEHSRASLLTESAGPPHPQLAAGARLEPLSGPGLALRMAGSSRTHPWRAGRLLLRR